MSKGRKQKEFPGRCGKREGAGRPAEFTEPVIVKVQIEQADKEAIENAGHKVPVFIREAMKRRLKEGW